MAEQTELQLLVGSDIADQLRTGYLPVGPTGRKIILDHPLGEGLGAHRRVVAQA
jgi:hypothetical protein